jgi:hypothetical protein
MSQYRREYRCTNPECGMVIPHAVSYVKEKEDWDDFATLVAFGLSLGEISKCPKCDSPMEILTKKTHYVQKQTSTDISSQTNHPA